MSIRVTIKQRDLIIAIAAVAIVLGMAGFVYSRQAESYEQSQAKYYSSKLNKLKDGVQTVKQLNEDEHTENDLSDRISQYQDNLAGMVGTCREIEDKYEKAKADQALKNMHESIDMASQLCKDLVGVAEYATSQSKATESLLLFDTSGLHEPSKAGREISKLKNVLNSTRNDLEKLKSDPVNDPAVNEQLALVDELQKLSEAAAGDPSKAPGLANRLVIHRDNLLNAREYFWRNTVGLSSLEKSITNLQGRF